MQNNKLTEFLKKVAGAVYKPNPRLTDRIKPMWLRTALYIVGYITALVYPFLCWCLSELIVFGSRARLLALLKEGLPKVTFALTAIYLAFFILWLLFRRAWIANTVIFAVLTSFSITAFIKYGATGEYFYPWDLQQTKNLGLLTDYVSLKLPLIYYAAIAVMIVPIALMFFTKPAIPAKWYIRIPAAALCVTLTVFSFNSSEKLRNAVESHGMSFFDAALPESNYMANGFTAGFLINCFSSVIEAPDGYSEKAISDILSGYESTPAKEDFSSPNIILVLGESFWDVTKLEGAEFLNADGTEEIDPLSNYHALCERDDVYTGSFFTTAFGGGTVRPEFEVMTGLTTDYLPSGSIPWQYVNYDFETYASYMKDFGYRNVMLHPYLSNFYMRVEKYPLLGFDETYFDEDLKKISEVERISGGGEVSDITVFDYVEYFMNRSEERDFIFAITMEGHQPYPRRFKEDEFDVRLKCDAMDEQTFEIARQYTQCAFEADEAIAHLIDIVDRCDEDSVVVYFGDHAPTLGANFAGYIASGFAADQKDMLSQEKRLQTYATPFFVYANFDLDENKTPRQLSQGMRVKYSLALALSHNADLLILDEPTSGLDPVSREDLLETFLRLSDEGKTVLFSTHVTSDLEKCASNIIYIKNGEVFAEDDMRDFEKKFALIETTGQSLPDGVSEKAIGIRRTKNGFSILFYANEVPFVSENIKTPTLEDIMVHVEKEGL